MSCLPWLESGLETSSSSCTGETWSQQERLSSGWFRVTLNIGGMSSSSMLNSEQEESSKRFKTLLEGGARQWVSRGSSMFASTLTRATALGRVCTPILSGFPKTETAGPALVSFRAKKYAETLLHRTGREKSELVPECPADPR